MKSKSIQKFNDSYLKDSRKLPPESILSFLEDFRKLHGRTNTKTESQLISIKIPKNLLNAFKTKASLEKIPYQTLIKKLMKKDLHQFFYSNLNSESLKE